MKTKSTIKLFATAILATAAIGAADVVNTAQNAFASEVSVTSRDGFPAVTFETDAVFKSFEDANSYAEGHAAEILDATKGYKDYSLSAEPALDGTSNYLVSGEIRAYKDYSGASVTAEEAKANIEASARKVVADANPSTPTTPTTPTTNDEPVEIPAVPVEPSAPSVTPSETPSAPTTPAAPSETPVAPVAPSVNPSETPVIPSVPSETPTTPTVPANNSETPVAPVTPSVNPSETPASPAAPVTPTAPTVDQNVPAVSNNSQSNSSTAPTAPTAPTVPTAPTAPTKPVEDNSKPTLLQNSDAKPAQSIVALAGGKKEDSKTTKSEDPKQSNTAKKDESKTESSKKSDSSEPVKKGEDKLKELPNTGEGASNLGIAGLMILSVLAGFFGFKKRNG